MKILLTLLLLLPGFFYSIAQKRTIHVFVALCDNENQGIVPVPKAIGNGQDPKTNLYWGAGHGVKHYFQRKTTDWKLLTTIRSDNSAILERLLFKHRHKDVYLLADAYDGSKIKTSIETFLKSANGQMPFTIQHDTLVLNFGGDADLLAYVGHDGLMDFDVDVAYNPSCKKNMDVMILACYSKPYFLEDIRKAKAQPVLWTTHLMAPEAYTLKSAIDGWILNETGKQIEERAAQTYHQYQNCGIKGARNLFTTGY